MDRPAAPGQRTPLGHYFAVTARLEAASVDAFRILRDELRAHEAPGSLEQARLRAIERRGPGTGTVQIGLHRG